MIVVTYVSTASKVLSDYDLTALLTQCRENNLSSGITGLLLYKDGSFMQTMEGDEDTVHTLYRKISRDPRHHGIIKLFEDTIDRRAFSQWSMAFQNLNSADVRKVPGYSEFLDTPLTSSLFKEKPTEAQKLLLVFREMFRYG